VSDPVRTEPVEPTACASCGAGLAGAPGDVGYSVQVFDLPALALEVTEYLMLSRVCGCGHATTNLWALLMLRSRSWHEREPDQATDTPLRACL
jgi:hypothetical protein